jgi:hypothetical protein
MLKTGFYLEYPEIVKGAASKLAEMLLGEDKKPKRRKVARKVLPQNEQYQ